MPVSQPPAPARDRDAPIDGEELAPVVRRAARGDEEAWRELARRYGRRLYALARSRVRHHELAEDIAQSVFATVADKLRDGEYTEEGKFEPWLFRIAMNRIRDEIRRQRVSRERLATVAEPEGVASARAEADDLGALRAAVARLDPAEQDVIALRHQAQLSFRAIAELASEPVGTLLARHHRALRKLRAMLESDDATRERP